MENFLNIPLKSDFHIYEILLFITAIIMIATCIRLIISKSLVESIILTSIFSLFISICYLLMDAPDVAMTETALGASLSTCVLLNLVKIVGENNEKTSKLKNICAFVICLIFVLCLCWAAIDLPIFGAEDSPLQNHLTKYYIENTHKEIGVPSIVAAILGSYRGYDTLGETAVVLIAGLAVIMIISRRKNPDA